MLTSGATVPFVEEDVSEVKSQFRKKERKNLHFDDGVKSQSANLMKMS